MDKKCMICDELVSDDFSEVGEKGILGLEKASYLRNDAKIVFFDETKSNVVHKQCRKSYTRPDSIKKELRKATFTEDYQQPPSQNDVQMHSPTLQFNFESNCLFCDELIDDEFRNLQKKRPHKFRRQVFEVRALSTDSTIALRARERCDSLGNIVLSRISEVDDLRTAKAIYHEDCYKHFFIAREETSKKRGRPEDDGISEAMEQIFKHIETNDECQFSFEELMELVSGPKPTVKTIQNKMKERYKDRIIFSRINNRKTVVCFRATGDRILNDKWYSSKSNDPQEERKRIVRMAANIILEDIETMAYDNSVYPPADEFCNGTEEMVPETLRTFMDCLSSSKRANVKADRKLNAIAHALISAIRPRSFVSPILHSVSLFIHRKFGSKSLIQLLSSLGFSGTYHDAQQLELSLASHLEEPITNPSKIFCQYVFDNGDFNISTINGLGTFHSMGGIKCLTPASALPKPKDVKRVKLASPSAEVMNQGVLDLQTLNDLSNDLLHVTLLDLNLIRPLPEDIFKSSLEDTLWLTGKWLQSEQSSLKSSRIPEWKGFMMIAGKSINEEKSQVVFTPFINSPPSDYNTIHTALEYALHDSREREAAVCFVTFDQPLYIKARKMQTGILSIRLGGFHLLMSYLGCIGHTMGGSGLKEVLSLVYATNSVEKMLTGHAYARAVRGHILVQAVLAQIVLEQANLSNEEKKEVTRLLDDIDNLMPLQIQSNCHLQSISKKIQQELDCVQKNGPTAALWVQYYNMVTLMKKFIDFERRGEWKGHLDCVQQMIPFFHASGHFNYAKCAHIYVQDMVELQSNQPEVFREFEDKGYFTINRTGKSWAGVWSDMTIEQTLMRSMKTSGGITRRGITDSVIAKWVGGLSGAAAICSSLEEFAGLKFSSGEQHVDFRESRCKRDEQDREQIGKWFVDHPPFPKIDCLMSLSTGVIGNKTVNCHQALEVGRKTMQGLVGCNAEDVKLSKKNVVLPIDSMSHSIKVFGEKVIVDPLTILQRTAIAKKSDEDILELVKFELSPFPLALFNEGGMRKGQKSTLYDSFPPEEGISHDIKLSTNVVDGGFLLHRVKWNLGTKVSTICDQYVAYLQKHYGTNCTVVFDGYGDPDSTKRAEQRRRHQQKTSVEIRFDDTMNITVQQEHLLSNARNKERLIEILRGKLDSLGINTLVAKGDADGTIVRCALEKSALHPTVTIIGEDTDLLVLLLALAPPDKAVFFLKPGRGKTESKLFSTNRLQQLPFTKSILLLHAFSGCDTTSAIYNKSKGSMVKLFNKVPNTIESLSKIFTDPSSTPDMVESSGERMFLEVYKASPKEECLNQLRYKAFLKASTKAKLDLASLPPTRGAAKQHSFRVYLQIQQWLNNDKIRPVDWGWVRAEDESLIPLATTNPAAPEDILNSIFCRCTTGCAGRCGCRRTGMRCSVVCTVCRGTCSNGAPVEGLHDSDNEI